MRDSTVGEAATYFETSEQTIRDWIAAGAPHDRIPSLGGGMKKIMVDVYQIEKWLKKHPQFGKKYFDEYLPISELTPYLLKLRGLGHTKKVIAEALEIPMSTLNTYLLPHLYPRLKNAPLEIYLKLKKLAESSQPVRHREKKLTLEEVKNALLQAKHNRTAAARLLKIQYATLINLIEEYHLEDLVIYPVMERITASMVKTALTEAKGNISIAARSLKIDDQSLRRIIKVIKLDAYLKELRDNSQL